jgi:BirA family biotin operon repressor/biotin-[acetyl-CoA-carboxylase] ligase
LTAHNSKNPLDPIHKNISAELSPESAAESTTELAPELAPEKPVIHQLGEISSTFDVAWELYRSNNLPLFASVLATSQTKGKGRFGNNWASPPGHIYAGIRLPLSFPFNCSLGSLALALMVSWSLEKLFSLRIEIKWPNDLIYQGQKIGGLLLESKPQAIVAGIGLNLGQSPPNLERNPLAPPAGALPGNFGAPAKFWGFLVETLALCYNAHLRGLSQPWATPETLVQSALSRLLGLGEIVTVHSPATSPPSPPGQLTGRLVGLDSTGALLVESSTGTFAVWSGTLLMSW